jgi:hypothetical protein
MKEMVAHSTAIKMHRSKKFNTKRVGLNPVNIEDDATVTVR